MNDGLGQAGITVRLRVEDGVIAKVAIDNRRLVSPVAPLLGRDPVGLPRLIAQLFSLCRVAQGLTAAEAVEDALGLTLSPPQQAARRFLHQGEELLEIIGHAALDWPILLEIPPDLTAVKAVRQALGDLWRGLYPSGDWMRPGGGDLVPDHGDLSARLARAKQAMLGAGMPLGDDWDDWLSGRAEGAARRLIAGVAARVDEPAQTLPPPLISLPGTDLAIRLAADDGTFLTAPDWDGTPRETGAYAALCDDPKVRAFGGGLAARFAARLLYASRILREMRDAVPHLRDDAGARYDTPAQAVGLGVGQTIRGMLAHRLELREGVVSRYQILAPTEWNFHPQGALSRALTGQVADGTEAKQLARLWAAALDPCVPCRVEVM